MGLCYVRLSSRLPHSTPPSLVASPPHADLANYRRRLKPCRAFTGGLPYKASYEPTLALSRQ